MSDSKHQNNDQDVEREMREIFENLAQRLHKLDDSQATALQKAFQDELVNSKKVDDC